jgi:hypothetical protein
MDFNGHIEKDLNNYIQKTKDSRYNNDVRKINYLLSLNISLLTIGKFLNKSHASVYNYKNNRNKISKINEESIDKLIKYSLSLLSSKINNPNYDLSNNKKEQLKKTIKDGEEILKTRRTVTRLPLIHIEGGR